MIAHDNVPLESRAHEIIRITAIHRRHVTDRDYQPLLREILPAAGLMSIDDICNRFRAFEREINPRWDGSIA